MIDKISFLPDEDLAPRFVVQALSEIADWGLVSTGIPEAHKYTKGEGITVAVLDTGVPNHNDLQGNILAGFNTTDEPSEFDMQGHGTHVSGIIAALENGVGVVGVAPQARILPIKVLGDNGLSGWDEIEKGVMLAINSKVDIINLSLGSPVLPPESFHDIIKEATSKGIIVISAAGNNFSSVAYPAAYDEVIAVAATDKMGNVADFSSPGPQVHIGAPGVNIYSTYLNNLYAMLCGTSQAAPFISGVCALILSWTRQNPGVPPISNTQEMLAKLDEISSSAGSIGSSDKIYFGIPHLANFMPWKDIK